MALFAVTILVSAFLLFQVQPVIAKSILPWFGGSSGVWATCLLFFQAALVLGYLYAHVISNRLRPWWQWVLHTVLLALSLAALPITPSAAWQPMSPEYPALRILALLSATIGLPYLILSSTGPLLQAWFSRSFPDKQPYRLYALSNVGSMAALVSYPGVVEPFLGTMSQAILWSAGYAIFVLLCAGAAYAVRTLPIAAQGALEEPSAPPGHGQRFLWMALAATASALLLSVTNHLSQNVAAIPFLWVVPLSLYLLSFIICFDRESWYARGFFLRLLAVALGVMAYAVSEEFENTSIKAVIPIFSAGLFIACMVCHGELARRKPHPRYLTSFYLMVALGGALGGLFVALVSPAIFSGLFELPVSIAACAVLTLGVISRDQEVFGESWLSGWMVAAALTTVLVVFLAVVVQKDLSGHHFMDRNFYGGLKVTDDGEGEDAKRNLTHGTINHGYQFLSGQRRNWPTTYYGKASGVGMAVQAAQNNGPVRIGVIGLGTGTLAAYGRKGDVVRFYEINPMVARIARRDFTFLSGTEAQTEIILGDARLSLEREAPEDYDVLALDAFSSDSIPVHLLTREAFRLYFRHLAPDGILAVHVSNRYLALEPVVAGIAESLGKHIRLVDTDDIDATGEFGSTWILVTSDPSAFDNPKLSAAVTLNERRKVRLWTDDYSNLFQILK
jgi:SAM-dependent methyltransferase